MSKHIMEFDMSVVEDQDELRVVLQARNMKEAITEYAELLRSKHKYTETSPESWSELLKTFWDVMLDNNVSIHD